MATSSSTDFDATLADIIQQAAENAGYIAFGQSVTGTKYKSSKTALNLLFKDMQAKWDFLHSREWRNQKFTDSSEVTGTDSEIYTCIRNHTSSTDDKPITGDNYLMHWKQEGDTGGVWATSTSYTSCHEFTLGSDVIGVRAAFIRDESQFDHKLRIIDFEKYLSISDKYNDSTIPTFLVCKKERDYVRAFLWPRPSNTNYHTHYLAVTRFEDLDSTNNNFDIPIEYYQTVVDMLSAKLAEKIGNFEAATYYLRKSNSSMDAVMESDTEEVSEMRIKPCY